MLACDILAEFLLKMDQESLLVTFAMLLAVIVFALMSGTIPLSVRFAMLLAVIVFALISDCVFLSVRFAMLLVAMVFALAFLSISDPLNARLVERPPDKFLFKESLRTYCLGRMCKDKLTDGSESSLV
jgi:hypothetical protein